MIPDPSMAVLSKVGGRQRNEDACGYSVSEAMTCCVLSDGAGGHGGGDVASRTAVESVLQSFEQAPQVSAGKAERMLHEANQQVILGQGGDQTLQDMRATLVLLLFDQREGMAVSGHIGDSRLYLFRGGQMAFRTRDHSVYQSMIDAGYIKPENASAPVQRTVLTGSLGGEEGFTPDIQPVPRGIQEGDAFLLCSDGFWEYLEVSDMEACLMMATSAQDWLDRMEARLLSRKKSGHDNYSAIAIWFGTMEFATRIQV